MTGTMRSLSIETHRLLHNELRPHERLLWTGAPTPSRLAKEALAPALFAIPWTAFSVFWTVAAGAMTSEVEGFVRWLFPLFGLPFVAIGIVLLTSPLRALRRAKATVYAITAERVLVFEPHGGSMNVRSFGAQDVAEIRRVQRADGSGDIYFGAAGNLNRKRLSTTGLLGLPDVRQVGVLLEALRDGT